MEYHQKFVPEGWNAKEESFDFEKLQNAKASGAIMEGFVNKCDEKGNLQIYLGKDRYGIIPSNEMDVISSDEFGIAKPSICKNKVNQFVQFKVKDICDEHNFILSRKEVGKEVLNWIKNDLKPGMVVNRNCQKYKKVWGICRYRWRHHRAFAH